MPRSRFFFHCPASYFCFVVSKGKFIKTKVTEKRQTVRLAKQGAACSEALLGVSSLHPAAEQTCSKCDSSERCRRSLPAAPEGWQSPALPFPPPELLPGGSGCFCSHSSSCNQFFFLRDLDHFNSYQLRFFFFGV